MASEQAQTTTDIRPLLQRLWPDPARENVTAHEISEALARIFVGGLSPVQTGSLLTALHFTAWDRRADVLAEASAAMRRAAAPVDLPALRAVVAARGRPEGSYRGGLVSVLLPFPFAFARPYSGVRSATDVDLASGGKSATS